MTDHDSVKPEAAGEQIAKADPFDPAALRLSQNFGATLGVKKALLIIPVRKPDRQWFVRTHPTLLLDTAVIELKEESETYLVAPDVRAALSGEIFAKTLILSVTPQASYFFWPIRLPDESGRLDDWNRSAALAALHARKDWVSVRSNRQAGNYDVHVAAGNLPEPEWPDLPLSELLRIAFEGRYIDSLDHPVVARLRGAS